MLNLISSFLNLIQNLKLSFFLIFSVFFFFFFFFWKISFLPPSFFLLLSPFPSTWSLFLPFVLSCHYPIQSYCPFWVMKDIPGKWRFLLQFFQFFLFLFRFKDSKKHFQLGPPIEEWQREPRLHGNFVGMGWTSC